MLEDLPIPNTLSPIRRLTPEDRMAIFDRKSSSIYNKYSVYGGSGQGRLLGAHQPFVYITVASSNSQKNITSHDSQALPFGSTILDVQRVTKFAGSSDGLLFIGKQYLLQRQNAFNETRIYNPISLISATAAKGSTGLIERPTRFLATGGGGFSDFAASSLLSFIGVQSKAIENKPNGAATGPALSGYVTIAGAQTNKGLLRYETGDRARSNFLTYFPSGGNSGKDSVGTALKNVLINKLKSFIPSTVPFISAGGKNQEWSIRPEYTEATNGVYEKFLADSQGLLAVNNSPPTAGSSKRGFLDTIKASLKSSFLGINDKQSIKISGGAIEVSKYHIYTPKSGESVYYNDAKNLSLIESGTRAVSNTKIHNVSIPKQLEKIKGSVDAWVSTDSAQSRRYTQMYKTLEDIKDSRITYPAYNDIPKTNEIHKQFGGKIEGPTVVGKRSMGRGFANDGRYNVAEKKLEGRSSVYVDEINKLDVLKDKNRNEIPDELKLEGGQSKDIVFFHFFDVVNNTYVPFRATISGLNEVHTPEWETVQYIGRADKLYLYKGFERTCNFNFAVYANSLEELVPMWKRINYLVGLTRPVGYTKVTSGTNPTKEFMVPPMVTLRLGDMYNDQPGIITSVSITVPEDAMWESYRGKGDGYKYLDGILDINYSADVISLQLPMRADISINMNLMEKSRAVVGDDHYGIIKHEFASS